MWATGAVHAAVFHPVMRAPLAVPSHVTLQTTPSWRSPRAALTPWPTAASRCVASEASAG
jgi:hypothetical protein